MSTNFKSFLKLDETVAKARYALAMRATCPRCKAAIGKKCVGVNGWLKGEPLDDPHSERETAAEKRENRVEEALEEPETVTITMQVRGEAKQRISELLADIQYFCAIGASRGWGIIDGDRGEGGKHYFDGDGSDKLIDVKVNGQPVKDLVKNKK